MPGKIDQAPFFSGGTPELSVQSAVAAGGGGPFLPQRELGKVYNSADAKRWQKVQYASVLTQASVVNNIVYWKDVKGGAIVDTDLTDSAGSRNTVAGTIATGSTLPTASQYAWVLQEADEQTMNGSTVNFLAGMKIVASATVGLVGGTAQATAAVDNVIGTVATAVDRSGGVGTVVCDIDIPSRLY